MKAYLIDFENVKSKGLTGIEQLSPDDKVIIFYSENSDTLNFEMHRKIMTSSADIEYLKVRVGGKNALDFQLSTLLGYLLAKELYTHIFIISGDKGFDKLHDFWNVSFADRNSITVFRTPTLAGAVSFAKDTKSLRKAPDPELEETDVPETAPEEVTAAEEPETPAAEEKPAEETPEKETLEKVTVTKSSRRRGRRPQSARELIHNSLLGIVDLSDKETDDILSCAAESGDKEDFHNRLAKIFKGHATDIYKVLRQKYLKIKDALKEQADSAAGEKIAVPERAAAPAAEARPAEKPAGETRPAKETEPVKQAEAPRKQHLNDSELFDQFLRECEEASKRSDAYEYQPQEQLGPEEPAAPAETEEEISREVKEQAEEEVAERSGEPEKAAPAEKKTRKRTSRKKPPKAGTSKVAEELGALLKDHCSAEEIAAVTELFEATDTKQKFYLGIVKKYRKERGCEIYKLIKSEYSVLASYKEL